MTHPQHALVKSRIALLDLRAVQSESQSDSYSQHQHFVVIGEEVSPKPFTEDTLLHGDELPILREHIPPKA